MHLLFVCAPICIFFFFFGLCLQTQLVLEPDEDWFHSLTISCQSTHCIADVFSSQWTANDVDLLDFLFTCSFVREKVGSRHACTHIHMLIVHEHTLPPPVTVMTLTFLFAIMCVGNVYLWRVDRFLLIGSLLPPHPHPITPMHTSTVEMVAAVVGLSLLRRFSAPPFPSTRYGNHNTIHLLAASAMPCDWDTSGGGRKQEGGYWGCCCAHMSIKHRTIVRGKCSLTILILLK